MKKSNFLKELKNPKVDKVDKTFSYKKPVSKPTIDGQGMMHRAREYKTVKDSSPSLVSVLKEKK